MKQNDLFKRIKEYLEKKLNVLVPNDVVLRAIKDRIFLKNLILSKNHHEWIKALFGQVKIFHSNYNRIINNNIEEIDLSKFNQVSDEKFNKRWNTCLICPHLIESPFPIEINGRELICKSDDRICEYGIVYAYIRARNTNIKCLSPAPNDRNLSRWGDIL